MNSARLGRHGPFRLDEALPFHACGVNAEAYLAKFRVRGTLESGGFNINYPDRQGVAPFRWRSSTAACGSGRRTRDIS
jgi:hypothetical protein